MSLEVKKQRYNFQNIIISILIVAILYFVFSILATQRGFSNDLLQSKYLEGFTVIFLSIILEAIPFIIIGAFISSIIQIFVSEEAIARVIPKNRFLGLFAASLMGIIFPICECAIIPVMRRLIKKGVPIHIATTFMLAVPIVNPVVLASTSYAFSGQWTMVFLRGFLGLNSAILIGHIVGILQGKRNPVKENISMELEGRCNCGCGLAYHNSSLFNRKKRGIIGKTLGVLEHTSSELYEVGRFFIIGAFLASLMQTFLSRSIILSVGQGQVTSTLVMMLLAFVLSLCSEADAFIARTFQGQFTTGSIIGFLIFGPMIDIKNTLMLGSSFKGNFVIKIVGIVFIVCFGMAMLVNLMGI